MVSRYIPLNSVYLGLRVRSDPWKGSIPAIVGHQPVHLVSQHDGKRHHLLSLVRGIPVHYSLVASSNVFITTTNVYSVSYFCRLLLYCRQYITRLVVKP
jgi:hypothetical protein